MYVKQNIASNFRVIPSDDVDSIWIKTSGTEIESHFGFFYCSPENGNSDFFEKVNEEIQKHNTVKNTYIFGDFNARTKTVCENIAHDKFDEHLGVENTCLSLYQYLATPRTQKLSTREGKNSWTYAGSMTW